MEILSKIVVFFIIIVFGLPIKFLVDQGILDKYIKNTEWFVSPINTTGDIIMIIWFLIWVIIFYLIIRAIVLTIYRFIKKRGEQK